MSDSIFWQDDNPGSMTDHLQFEQITISPHVLQFMTDYLFVHEKLLLTGIAPTLDMGMGDADVALSIVNDAYEHQRRSSMTDNQIIGSLALDNS